MKNILITGGTGLIGKRLTQMLIKKGYQVSHLSRSAPKNTHIPTYLWNIEQQTIDPKALENADIIIHLAGAGIADERWTDTRKKELISSRTDSLQLIYQTLQRVPNQVSALISSSGIGYYGANTGNIHITEQSPAGTDFLARICMAWEQAAQQFETLGIRTTILRTGIVLSKDGGALPKLAMPIRWGVGAAIGSGKQWQSWIHIDDMCRLYIKAIEDNTMQGIYNAVSPQPITNQELTSAIAKSLHRPLWLPNIPNFAMKLLLGEMAVIITGGNYVCNARISQETDFTYQYEKIELISW
jgi:uncharacterized protein